MQQFSHVQKLVHQIQNHAKVVTFQMLDVAMNVYKLRYGIIHGRINCKSIERADIDVEEE